MNGADEARETIHKVARPLYAAIHHAGSTYAKCHGAVVQETDVVHTMGRAADLIIALENLKEMATEAERLMRSVLAQTMNDTGCTQVTTSGQMAYLSRKPAFVSVDQPDLVPSDYMRQPPPTLDKKAIKTDIEDGKDVPGCTLIRPNELQLNIKVKKE